MFFGVQATVKNQETITLYAEKLINKEKCRLLEGLPPEPPPTPRPTTLSIIQERREQEFWTKIDSLKGESFYIKTPF